jgi:hypothetical protein
MPKYLFVCGCPRSGTSILQRTLAQHPAIVLGGERYAHRVWQANGITPDLFTKSRFFDVRAGDTFYTTTDIFPAYYSAMHEKFDDAMWIGEKSPELYMQYGFIDANFDDEVHFLYIVRNIFDIAASYQQRATNPADVGWATNRDYSHAIHDWKVSMERTLAFLNDPNRRARLSILSYEDLFVKRGNLDSVLSLLGLDPHPAVSAFREREFSKPSAMAPKFILGAIECQTICEAADFDLYRAVLSLRLDVSAGDFASSS